MEDLATIRGLLQRQDCELALNHLDQAEAALGRSEFESANAQVRAMIEALFDRISEVRLGTVKRGGAARKELEGKGILDARTARFVQTFMDVAGGNGSHAGTSSPDEARGRFLVGLGVAYLGLALMPEFVRVETAMSMLSPAPRDSAVTTLCPTCKTKQTLTECQVKRDGQDTVYVCRNGCQVLVAVGSPGGLPWPGRGYRLGEHVIRNANDLVVGIQGTAVPVLIPASPSALMKTRPPESHTK